MNKYLSFNNVWTVERVASEFKAIHANRVSFVQNQKSRSPSPMNSQRSHSPMGIHQEDGRKYKKGVAEEHFSQFTFKPNLGQKTKDLDSKLTQKLLQETNLVRQSKRDASADALMRS